MMAIEYTQGLAVRAERVARALEAMTEEGLDVNDVKGLRRVYEALREAWTVKYGLDMLAAEQRVDAAKGKAL